MALHTRASAGRPASDRYQRRVELYRKAAPVFRTFGYRQVTMKALAHACGLSAPALYRYFPTKLDFALFPLEDPPTGFYGTLLSAAADAHDDPLRALRAALEATVAYADLIALAVGLAIEAGRDAPETLSREQVVALDTTLRDVLLRCVPGLGACAQDLAHALVSLVVTAGAARVQPPREELWRQGGPILRGYLLDAGIDEHRICEAFTLA